MPLKIKVRPEEKCYVGGAVLKNVGKAAIELLILSDSPVLRDSYLMEAAERKGSDAAEIYFLLQMLYLFKGKGQALDGLVIQTIRNFAQLYPKLQGKVDTIIQHLEAGETFKALKIGHAILAAPDETTADSNLGLLKPL